MGREERIAVAFIAIVVAAIGAYVAFTAFIDKPLLFHNKMAI